MEAMIDRALRTARIRFTRDNRNLGRPQQPGDVTLDFHLVDLDLYIEVKQFHSARVASQMAQAPNVIVAQGETAVRALADMIAQWRPGKLLARDER
jgi:hypothetical protein